MEDSGANSKKRSALNKWHWTHKEDELLSKLVKRHGPGNWNFIANRIAGRSGMSCRLRWVNHLNPKVNKTPFSEEEQERLLELHRDFGNRWSTIASFFPGRTDNQLKNQYHVLMARQKMKASGTSSSTDRRGHLKIGSLDLGRYVGSSRVEVGSQFGRAPRQGNTITAMPEKMKMALSSGGFSSIHGRNDATWFAARYSNLRRNGSHSFDVNVGNIYANLRTSLGDSMISDGRSGAMPELCPVAQPQQAVNAKNYRFIDFLGVGNSE